MVTDDSVLSSSTADMGRLSYPDITHSSVRQEFVSSSLEAKLPSKYIFGDDVFRLLLSTPITNRVFLTAVLQIGMGTWNGSSSKL